MRPVEVYVKNFLSYKEETLTFPEHKEVLCVTGLNGEGKSSLIVDAILFALFGQGRAGKLGQQELIRDGEDDMKVAFTFIVSAGRFRVTRQVRRGRAAANIKLEKWGPEGWGSPVSGREVQIHLQGLLPYSYDTFTHTAFVLQGQTDRFLKAKAEDRQSTLSEVLGLLGYEERSRVAKEKRLEAERSAESRRLEADRIKLDVQARRSRAEAELETSRSQLEDLQDEAEPLHAAVSRAAVELQAIRQAYSEFRDAFGRFREASAETRKHRRSLHSVKELLAKAQQDVDRREALRPQAVECEKAIERQEAMEAVRRDLESLNREIALTEARHKGSVDLLQHQITSLEKERPGCLQQISQGQVAAGREPGLEQLVKAWEELEGVGPILTQITDATREIAERIRHIEKDEGQCPYCLQELKGDSRGQALIRLRHREQELVRQQSDLLSRQQDLHRQVAEGQHLFQVRSKRDAEHGRAQASVQKELASKAEHRLAELDLALSRLAGELNNDRRQAEVELAPLRSRRDSLQYDAAAHEEVRETIRGLQAVLQQFRSLENAESRVMQHTATIRGFQAAVDAAENARRSWAAQSLQKRSAARGFQAAQARYNEADKAYKAVLEQENTVRSRIAVLEGELNRCKTDEERAAALSQEASDHEQRTRLLGILEKAYGRDGIPALIVANALPSLLDKANRLLYRWTDGRIRIEPKTHQVLGGERRGRVNLSDLQFDIWDTDSDLPRPYNLYSGGERFRVDMALRIALSQLLAERAGSPVQMLVIDEGFGTQDRDGLQKMVEIIADIRSIFDTIVVISHIEEIKRLEYDRWIRVVKENGVSRIAG